MSDIQLESGANAVLPDQETVRIRLACDGPPLPRVAVVLLDANRRATGSRPVLRVGVDEADTGPLRPVRDPARPDDVVVAVDLSRLGPEVAGIEVCLIRGPAPWPGSVSAVADSPRTGARTVRFDLATAKSAETVLVFTSLYRHSGVWKLRAFGQGYAGGVERLAQSFGLAPQMLAWPAAPPPPVEPPPLPTPATGARTAAPPPAPAPEKPAGRISLAKRGEGISLEKKSPTGFGEIRFSLAWQAGSRGLFGGSAVDLDLGCLWELTDGDKGVVQALGNTFGSYDSPPFLKLSGDDRRGGGGEEIRINGNRIDRIRRLVVFAYIYRGAPNWRAAEAVATVAVPGHPLIEVRLDTPERALGMCAIARIETAAPGLRVTREERYVRGHRYLDRAFGWGLSWVAGSKDD